MGKKEITKKGYRVLAVVWTLAAASMATAFVRRLAEFNLFLLLMMALSTLIAANMWKTYQKTPEEIVLDPFDAPPKFADDPVLFDDDPPQHKNSEENNHE